jgi:hypothetical protein
MFEKQSESPGADRGFARNKPMTDEERDLMNTLCAKIAIEKDPTIFDQLVHELNELLEKKEHRLKPDAIPN